MRHWYVLGFMLYVSIAVSVVSIYNLLRYAMKFGELRAEWFVSGAMVWIITYVVATLV